MDLLFPWMVFVYWCRGKTLNGSLEVQKTGDRKECTQAWRIKGGPKGCFDLASGLSNCCWSTDYGTVLISTVFNQVRYQTPAILSLGSRRQEHPIQGPPRLRMEVEASLGYCLKKQTKQ